MRNSSAVKDGDAIVLRNDHGQFRGRVKIDRIKPGAFRRYWPEVNVLIPAGRLDASGVPDYNAIVEVFPANRALEPQKAAAVPA